MITLEDAAKMMMALPDVVIGERFGRKTWLVNDRGFAWERPFSKADLKRFAEADETPPDGPILALVVADLMEKDAAIAANPKAFFTIQHFNGYPAILVQLDKVTKTALKVAIGDAYAVAVAKPKPKPRPKAKAKAKARRER